MNALEEISIPSVWIFLMLKTQINSINLTYLLRRAIKGRKKHVINFYS